MPDDPSLLRRYARQRAQDAFGEFVRRHLDGVYRAALRRVGGDTHLAEDIAQQVFTAAALRAETLAGCPAITGWLYATTRNVAANVVRRERRRKTREEKAHAMLEPTSPESGSLSDWSRIAPLLDQAIDRLSESDRAVILHRFVERLAFRDIGARLALSEDAARMRVDRALEKLRAQLARRGVTSTSAAIGLLLAHEAALAAPAGLAASVAGAAAASTAGAAVVATTGSWIAFMSTSKTTAVLAALVLTFGLGVGVYEIRADRESLAAQAAVRREIQALKTEAETSRQRLASLSASAATLKHTVATARLAATPAFAASGGRGGPAGGGRGGGGFGGDAGTPTFEERMASPAALAAGQALIASQPEVRRMMEAVQETNFDSAWSARLAPLHLSAEEREKVYAEVYRLWPAVLRIDGNATSIRTEAADHTAEIEHFVRDLVGETRFEAYERQWLLGAIVPVTKALAAAVQYSDTPLTSAQADSLVRVLERYSARPDAHPRTTHNQWLFPDPPALAAALPELSRILSPVQLQAFQVVIESGAASSRWKP